MAVAFALLAWQLVLPGFIGMANNGDFGKVAGLFSIGGADNGAENFEYFKSDYLRDPRFYIDFGLPSSEHVLAGAASLMEQGLGNPRTFDIRWLGSLHGLLWLGGYGLLLMSFRSLDGVAWWIAMAASLWIFMDVMYVAYMNSFYTDVAALLGAMTVMALVPRILLRDAGAVEMGLFGAAAVLLVSSKGQHAPDAVLLGAFSIAAGWMAFRRDVRVIAFVAAAAILAGGARAVVKTPVWYPNMSRFSVIFYKLLPGSATLARDAAELGLAADDLKYVGSHAFLPGSPAGERAWIQDFSHRGSYGTLFRFYLRHPARTLRILWSDLSRVAWQNRPMNLSNFRRADGHPPWAHTPRMASWSTLRSRAFVAWPGHMILWYALALIGGPVVAWRSGSRSRQTTLVWAIFLGALLGVTEFGVASLGDALETERHLLLFQLFTDFTVFFAVCLTLINGLPGNAGLADRLQNRR